MKEGTPQRLHRRHIYPFGQRRFHVGANKQHKEARLPTASKRLDTLSRPGQEAALPRNRPDVSQTRHCHPVNCYKATCRGGTDSTFGGKMPECV